MTRRDREPKFRVKRIAEEELKLKAWWTEWSDSKE